MDLTAGKAVSVLKRVDRETRDLLNSQKTSGSDGTPSGKASGGQLISGAKDALDQSLLDTVDLSPGTGVSLSAGAADLLGEMSDKMQPLLSLIDGALGRQKGLNGVQLGGENASLDDLRAAFGADGVPDDVQAKAQELLDTYFSVEETSDRIFSFAFSFYDGSEDKAAFAERMGSYIDEGFRQAEKQLGGLAEISVDTYKAIQDRIDDFVGDDGESEGERQTTVATQGRDNAAGAGLYTRGGANVGAAGGSLNSLF
ncbi:hypothetical protein [Acanthopleuribacter pedis]|uniref:DUF5610 domain-containing protein n=1 Tax=Acanthopleuribacter pedis TaxID=442870 RepID=A0A8J7QKK2_9BACT|nr:hypothetical protein [Acanthopleuribacter pedis]MBO1319750.1 hypothetical protein [Acanthopleuribacter pedis]